MITAAEFLKFLQVFNVQYGGGGGPITIPVSMSQGGTGANLTAANNSLFYSTGSSGALLPSVANNVFVTDNSGNLEWSNVLPAGITVPNPSGGAQIANYQWVLAEILTIFGGAVELVGSTMTGPLYLSGDPSSSTQAATKNYVDLMVAGLTPSSPVAAASTVDIPATYYNGAGNDGIGATLTITAPGAVTLDGVTTALNGVYLFKDQSDATTLGIYECTTEGTGPTQAVFTRATTYDTPTEINNTGIIPVIGGSTQAGFGYLQTNTIVTIGTTDFQYIKFGNTGTVTSVATGTGLTGGTITGSGTISLANTLNNTILANISGVTAAPIPNSLSDIIDSCIDNTQGDILYRNASGWVVLPPGTAGNVLTTGGAAANPSWTGAALGAIADGDLLANTSGGSAIPVATTLTALIDYAIGSTQGDILYRNASGWVVLAPGTSSQFLKSGGASANPSWANPLLPITDGDLLANISGSSAAPIATTLTALIDYTIGSTQGDILYRNASGWVVLAPGTAGKVLTTGGASANPSWAGAALTSIADGDILANISGSAGIPSAHTVSDVLDYTLGSAQGDILYRGASGWVVLAPGTANQFLKTAGAGADPVWANSLLAIADGDLLANISGGSAAPIATTLTALIDYAIGSTQGDILYRNASGWVALAPGTNGQFLMTGGAAANPSWGSVPAGTVTSVATGTGLTGGTISTTGTISFAAITDGDILANISGGSSAPIPHTVSDVLDYTIGNVQGDILYRNASGWVVLAPGTNGQFLKTGGAAANPSWASGNAGTVTSVATGSGLTGGTITSTGTVALAAIADHTLLANISGSSAAPSSTTLTALIDNAIGSTQGDILYRNATSWVVLPPGTSGQVLQTGGAAANPAWATVGGSGTVSSGTVNDLAIYTGTTTVGSLATANNSILATNGSGVPAFTTTMPSAVQLGVANFNSGTGASSSTFLRGDNTWAAGSVPSGTLFNYQQGLLTSAATLSTSAAWTDTGVTVNITPTSSSNKVSVRAVLNIFAANNQNYRMFRLVRNSTAIGIADAAGSRQQTTSFSYINVTSAPGGGSVYLETTDTPATTSATTYKVQYLLAGGDTFYINRTDADGDNANTPRGVSSITVCEIQS